MRFDTTTTGEDDMWLVTFNDDTYYFDNEDDARSAAALVAANNIANPRVRWVEPVTLKEFQQFMVDDYSILLDDVYDAPEWGAQPRSAE